MSPASSATVALTSYEGLPGIYVLYELLKRGYVVRIPMTDSLKLEWLRKLWKAVYGSIPNTDSVVYIQGSLQDWDTCEALLEGSDYVIHTPDLFDLSIRADRDDMNAFVHRTSRLVDLALGSTSVKKLIYVSSTAAFSRAEPEAAITTRLLWKDHRHNTFFNKALMKAELEVWRGNAEGLKTAILNPGYMIGYWPGLTILGVVAAYNGALKGRHGFVDVRDVARAAAELLESDYSGTQEFLIAESLSFETLRRIARENYSAVSFGAVSGSNSQWKRGWLRLFRFSPSKVSPFLLQDFSMSLSFKNEDATSVIQLKYTDIKDSLSFFADVVRRIHQSQIVD